jgi:hypothetical protein
VRLFELSHYGVILGARRINPKVATPAPILPATIDQSDEAHYTELTGSSQYAEMIEGPTRRRD